MSSFERLTLPHGPNIYVHGLESIGPAINAFAQNAPANSSGTWPSANQAIFIPFRVTESFYVAGMLVMNGSTASGNLDLGVYDAVTLARQCSSGSTAQSGTSQVQYVAMTAPVTLPPGRYYMAMVMNGTSGTTLRAFTSTAFCLAVGIQQMSTAFPLPATATFDGTFSMANNTPELAVTSRSF